MERTTILLFGSLSGQLSESEQAELQQWLDASPEHGALLTRFEKDRLWESLVLHRNIDTSDGLRKLKEAIGKSNSRKIPLFRFSIAAAILIVAGISLYFYLTMNKQGSSLKLQRTPGDVALIQIDSFPQLRLSDGKVINLDSVTSGTITENGDLIIQKTGDHQLVYSHSNPLAHTHEDILYNTIIIPAGKPWKLTLPEGSNVWINVQTVLSYPIVTGSFDRVVSLKGEGYFDVAEAQHDGKKIPFIVNAEGCEINVTGTRFNVNAYPTDTSVLTTLLEGRVNVTSNGVRAKLKPGQGAILNKKSSKINIQKVDTSSTTIWTTGTIKFNNTPYWEVLKMIGRYYNVKFTYDGVIQFKDGGYLTAEITTSMPLKTLLKNLGDVYVVDFVVEGKEVFIRERKTN